jgi:hypothetical protein
MPLLNAITYNEDEDRLLTQDDKFFLQYQFDVFAEEFREDSSRGESCPTRWCRYGGTSLRVLATFGAAIAVLGGLSVLQSYLSGDPYNWHTVTASIVGLFAIALTVSTEAFTMPVESALTWVTFRAMLPESAGAAAAGGSLETLWFRMYRILSLNAREARDTVGNAILNLGTWDALLRACFTQQLQSEGESGLENFCELLSEALASEIIPLYPDMIGSPEYLRAFQLRMHSILRQNVEVPGQGLAQRVGVLTLRKRLLKIRRSDSSTDSMAVARTVAILARQLR